MEAWKDDSCARSLKNKTIYVNYNNCCYKHPLRKRVRIWSYSGPHFSSIFPHLDWIQRDTPNTDSFYAVIVTKMEWQQPQRKNNFLSLMRKQTFDFSFFFFISIMLYQETQLLCHLNYALPENTVIMWTDITDSLLIALGCKHFLNTLKNWLEVG